MIFSQKGTDSVRLNLPMMISAVLSSDLFWWKVTSTIGGLSTVILQPTLADSSDGATRILPKEKCYKLQSTNHQYLLFF